MQDPFSQSQGPIDQADNVNEDNFYDQVNKIHTLLRELHQELDNMWRDDSLQGVLEDEDIDEQLIKLSAILPSYTLNSHITPVMKSISDLQKAIAQVSDRLDKSKAQLTQNSKNKSLSGSIHATPVNPPMETSPLSPSYCNKALTSSAPLTTPPKKPIPPTTHAQKIPSNPNSSYHPSRLIVQLLPRGVPDNIRPKHHSD